MGYKIYKLFTMCFFFFSLLLCFFSILTFIYFICVKDYYFTRMRFFCFYSLFDWIIVIFIYNILFILLTNILSKRYSYLLFINFLFGGFFFSYVYSGGEFISNKFISFFIFCDKIELSNFLDNFLITKNINFDLFLKDYLLSNTFSKCELNKKLIWIYIICKSINLHNLTLEHYENLFINKFSIFFYLYIIFITLIFLFIFIMYVIKINKIKKFEKSLYTYYNINYTYYFTNYIISEQNYVISEENDNLFSLWNLRFKYSNEKYNNYLVYKLQESLFFNVNKFKLDTRFHKLLYEFNLPLHLELMYNLDINNINNDYKFLNVILYSDNSLIANIFLDLSNEIFNLNNKIYFVFYYEGICFDNDSDSIKYTYDILLCVNTKDIDFIKEKIKQYLMTTNININISLLENVNKFFDRTLYYKTINKSVYILAGQNFYFFRYNFDIFKFYIIGEYMLSNTLNRKLLMSYIEEMHVCNNNIFSEIYYYFRKDYYLSKKIPSYDLKYKYGYISYHKKNNNSKYNIVTLNNKYKLNYNYYQIIMRLYFDCLVLNQFILEENKYDFLIKKIDILCNDINDFYNLIKKNDIEINLKIKMEYLVIFKIIKTIIIKTEFLNKNFKKKINELEIVTVKLSDIVAYY